MKKKFRKTMFASVIMFFAIMIAGCELDSNSSSNNSELQPLHKINLEDGGEVVFYEEEPGNIITIMTANSEEVFNDLCALNCIEICEKYGNGIIPTAVSEAYNRSVELDNEDIEEANSTENNQNSLSTKSGLHAFGSISHVDPRPHNNMSFNQFCQASYNWYPYPSNISKNYSKAVVKSSDNYGMIRVAIPNLTKDLETAKWTRDYVSTCYVVKGVIRLRVERREWFTLMGWGKTNEHWRTVGNHTFSAGQWGGYKAVCPLGPEASGGHYPRTQYKIKAQVLRSNTQYHLFLLAGQTNKHY